MAIAVDSLLGVALVVAVLVAAHRRATPAQQTIGLAAAVVLAAGIAGAPLDLQLLTLLPGEAGYLDDLQPLIWAPVAAAVVVLAVGVVVHRRRQRIG